MTLSWPSGRRHLMAAATAHPSPTTRAGEPARARLGAGAPERDRFDPRVRAWRRLSLERQGRRGGRSSGRPRRQRRGEGRSRRRALRTHPGGVAFARRPLNPRARRSASRRSLSRRCPCSRPPATTWPSTSPTTPLSDVAFMRGQMSAQDGRRTTGLSATPSRRDTSRRDRLQVAPAVASSVSTPATEAAGLAGRERASEQERNYFLRAYRAGALAMLGRFDEAPHDPRRNACRTD